jgi:putative nucleotidyltransferase with HDIG domain
VETRERIAAECPYASRWGKNLFVHYYLEPLLGADGQVSQVQVQLEDITSRKLAEEQADRLHDENARLLERLQLQNAALVQAYEATIEGWSRALEMRDKETKGHSERVKRLSLQLGRRVGLGAVELIDLRRGVLLHDIGKMVTPDAILLKPGPLTDEEWKVMRQHPTYAYQMLHDIPFLERALDIPWAHHENYDGSGYPRGLKGDAIPYGARIFALVDVWDALTSDRPYRPAWPPEAAMAFIVEQSGKRFDPRLTGEFLRMMAEDGC